MSRAACRSWFPAGVGCGDAPVLLTGGAVKVVGGLPEDTATKRSGGHPQCVCGGPGGIGAGGGPGAELGGGVAGDAVGVLTS